MKSLRLLNATGWAILSIAASVNSATLHSHPVTRPQQQKQESKSSAQKPPVSEKDVLRDLQKQQAVQLLRDALDSSASIDDLGQQSILVARAAPLLWGYDQDHARLILSNSFEKLLGQYKDQTVVNWSDKLRRLDLAANRLVKAAAQKDQVLADSMLRRLAETKHDVLKDTAADPSNQERLSIAEESLRSDLKRSAEIAANVLKYGVPLDFPQYLYDLQQIDASTADDLYASSLVVLASGEPYGATDAIQLSAYPFREAMILLPIPDPQNEGGTIQFGFFTKSISTSNHTLAPNLASAYLSAAYSYIAMQLEPGRVRGSDPVQLVQMFFLATKLTAYSARMGTSHTGEWQQLKFNLQVRCRNAKVDEATIENIRGYAERLGNADDVFQFGDDSSFDRAKNERDEQKRNQLLVRGIWTLMQGQRFQEAEKKITDIHDDDIKGKLKNLLAFYIGKHAVKNRDWPTISNAALRITDPRVKLLLLLEGAKASRSPSNVEQNTANDFLIEANSVISKIDDKGAKAKALIALASFAIDVNPQLGREAFANGIKFINASDDYDADDFRVEVTVLTDFRVMLPLANSNLDTCVTKVAKQDWLGTVNLISDVKSSTLRILARVFACGAVL